MFEQKSKKDASASPFQALLTRAGKAAKKNFSDYSQGVFVHAAEETQAAGVEAFVETLTRCYMLEAQTFLFAAKLLGIGAELVMESVIEQLSQREGALLDQLTGEVEIPEASQLTQSLQNFLRPESSRSQILH
jgi:hypothetical protein